MIFIEIDGNILQTIGFKNFFTEEKDKNGSIKLDEKGTPKLQDNHKDFNSAIRSLDRTHGFMEGAFFEDPNAHFVIKKQKKSSNQRGGHNRQSIWVHEDMLDKWIKISKNSSLFRKHVGNGLCTLYMRKESSIDSRSGTLQILKKECYHYKQVIQTYLLFTKLLRM